MKPIGRVARYKQFDILLDIALVAIGLMAVIGAVKVILDIYNLC